MFDEVHYLNVGVAQRTFQSVAIDLVMKWKDNDPSIGMLQL